ncbi:MAG: hypothetical protein JWN14_826 [Chthonomonadales bacterium]|nr:hypothetical protein [Chthonomonadales bacterium]
MVTMIAGVLVLALIIGVIGAVAKRLFRLAMTLGVIMLLIVGAVVFVISNMH